MVLALGAVCVNRISMCPKGVYEDRDEPQLQHTELPKNVGWVPVVRPSRHVPDSVAAGPVVLDVSSDRLHLPADIGADLR